jgi:hypothetical protein
VHDGVESVDGVSGVLDSTTGAVGLHKTVAALDDVSAAALLLTLGVSGQSVLDVVSVAVLGIGVVVSVDGYGSGYLGDSGGGVGKGSGYLSHGGGGVGKGSRSYSGGCIGHRGGHCPSEGSSGDNDGGGADDTGPGDGHDCGEDEQLKIKERLHIVTTRRGHHSSHFQQAQYLGSLLDSQDRTRSSQNERLRAHTGQPWPILIYPTVSPGSVGKLVCAPSRRIHRRHKARSKTLQLWRF